MSDMSEQATQDYGLTAVPADQSKNPPATESPSAVSISELQPPSTPLAKRIQAYAKSKLSPDTYRHSMRVYSYGCAVARQCYPQFGLERDSKLEETWFLTAMLHDIGTSDEYLKATRLSFEFWGGYHALDLLQNAEVTTGGDGGGAAAGGKDEAPRAQAESVAEAIIRHQDLQDKGMITVLTRLIHLGTLLDNVGAGEEMVSRETIEGVVGEYPRKGWSGCFSRTVREEKSVKPYAMVSRIEGFEDMIEQNGKKGVMSEFE